MKFLAFFGVLLAVELVASMTTPQSMEELEANYRNIQELLQDDGLTPEERFNLGAMGNWIKQRAVQAVQGAAQAFMNAGGANLLNAGKQLLLSSVQVQEWECEGLLCESCLTASIPPLSGKSACVEFGLTSDNDVQITFSMSEQVLLNRSLDLNALTAKCASLPVVGEVCVQGLKQSDDNSICLAAVITQLSIGREACVKYANGKFIASMNSTGTISASVVNNQVVKLVGNVVTPFLS